MTEVKQMDAVTDRRNYIFYHTHGAVGAGATAAQITQFQTECAVLGHLKPTPFRDPSASNRCIVCGWVLHE